MKKGFALVLALAMMAIMVTGCAHGNKTEGATERPVIIRGTVAVMKSTVVAVDLKNRVVTLRDAAGDVSDFKVGKAAVNLPQVKAGDIVTIKFYESVAVEVIKPGTPATAGQTTAIVRATPGKMPGGIVSEQAFMTATVKTIDKKGSIISLMLPNGKTLKVKVEETANLEKVKVGDDLMITYTEAEVISVDRPE